MAVSIRAVLVVFAILALLAIDYHYMFRAPSLELIAFINRVTGNDLFFDKPVSTPSFSKKVASAPVAASDVTPPPAPAADANANAIAEEVSVVASATKRRFAAAEASGSKRHRKEKAESSDAVVVAGQLPAETPLPDFRTRRFGAKLHMIFQGQFFLDYPISYYLTVDVGMADWWWMSANLISMIHPFVGLLAGYIIVKSSYPPEKNTAKENRVNNLQVAPQSPQGASTSAAFEHISLMPVASPVAPTVVTQGGPATPPASVVMLNASASPTHPIKSIQSSAAIVEFDAVDSEINDNNELVEKSESRRRLFSSVNMKLLRLGAVLFWLRNYLDTFDGVMARVQRHRAGIRYTSTTMGFNGHSLDVLNDALGGLCVMLGVFFMLLSKNLPISRIPSAILVRLGFRQHLSKSQIFSKIVGFLGLLYLLLTGTCWETFMLRYSNLFDQHANTNAAIFALDSHPHVRFNQWLWSMVCGDSLMQYVLIAMLWSPQKVWELTQFYFFVGIPGVLTIFAYSFWVWDNVVLQNPVAARIIAENPEQFI